ncbi:hypothetical protein GCM10008012_02280 [Rhizobium anhuiense]|nr:hypothetical protein GCM10008012_02280 [Rhizobium anhuiense]
MLRSCPPSFADGESGVRIREQQGRGEAKDVSDGAEMVGKGPQLVPFREGASCRELTIMLQGQAVKVACGDIVEKIAA